MKRRDFIKYLSAIQAIMIIPAGKIISNSEFDESVLTNSRKLFNQIAELAQKENWQQQDIGDLIIKIARKFLGIRYKAFTLEGPGPEVCRINLSGLDCVTLFENSLCMARIFKKRLYDFDSLINEITFTRYRDGKLNKYASRLHYTSEWIYDNIRKKVVTDVTKNIGGIPLNINVSFMSNHPEYYPKLQENPDQLELVKNVEKKLNNELFYYIPQKKISEVEKYLKNGDIIAISTDKIGLDYSHTGLIYLKDKKEARFLHASTTHKKVIIDKRISEYVNSVKSHTGITVLRPL